MLLDRIGPAPWKSGIVVGLIEPSGRRVIGVGARALGDAGPMDADTLFEIGSITKVFTSLLLSDAVGRNEVSLDDPVAKLLPASVHVPERGRAITLVDLATHTSGLPRLPSNLQPAHPRDPYADYSVDQLYQFLSGYSLPRDVGASYEYSNLGGGLLGHALALRLGENYEALVRSRIAAPLGMPSTVVTLTPELKARLATAHDEAGEPTDNWNLPTLAGAGALRS
ncbi:MAG TPA: serine hydrolase, partial [Polyangiaceae bacterium]|nr:serine hydrolase [Polyangiaceae bacterium]